MGGSDGTAGHTDAELVLSDSERDTLERWARRHTSAQALALRCRIVLACAEGGSNIEVAELTTKWLKRGTHRPVKDLVASIRTWITNWNDEPKPFIWHKSADEILDALAN
jgi:hypothetical protein